MHGDNTLGIQMRGYHDGSPPCAWGQLPGLLPEDAGPWFTPMCMGTTESASVAVPTAAVHPHVHGDKVVDAL